MASSLLYLAEEEEMGAPSDDPITGESSTGDLGTFNRWLCISRLRATGAVAVFSIVVYALRLTPIDPIWVLAVCAGLCLISVLGLGWRRLNESPVPFFYTQTVIDVIGITVGIGASLPTSSGLLFHLIYVLVIVPASLFSALAGFTFATVSTIGHEILLVLERGFSFHTLVSLESLVPSFLFFLVAQQAIFYGSHLHNKNRMLGALAGRLKESRQKLAAEGRLSAALVDAAQTLSATLDAPVLLDHLTRTTREHLCADWSATFLVDAPRGVFRMAAATDAQISSSELSRIEFPIASWSAVGRVTRHRVVVLTGEPAEATPEVFTGDKHLETVLLAALHKESDVVGFLAVGYGSVLVESSDWALRLLAGIAEHATVVLHNAHLLEEVRQASALKSEFVGAISHELRSPLNVVLGYLEMALDGGLGPIAPEMAEAFRRARRQSVELLELITALLDLNRLEAGRLPVHRSTVAPGELLQAIVQQLPENWQRENVEVRLQLAGPLPVVETDAQKLKTIVRNLVHNALKFTDRGHVTIGGRATPNGELEITVADSGRGIPEEAVPYVFDMFRQVPGSGGGGVGLGLHIVQRFVEVLGGTVQLSSEVGVGTCFTVTLPPASPTYDETLPAPARAA